MISYVCSLCEHVVLNSVRSRHFILLNAAYNPNTCGQPVGAFL